MISRKILFILLLLFSYRESLAQSLDTIISLEGGSGLSMGTGSGSTINKMSPIFIAVEAGLIFDGDRELEYTPALIFEVGGRVSIGIDPTLKKIIYSDNGKWGFYGAVGVPFYFAPFTLIGAKAGLGSFYQFSKRLALALDLRINAFFAGSDLPDDSALIKLDLGLALRFEL